MRHIPGRTGAWDLWVGLTRNRGTPSAVKSPSTRTNNSFVYRRGCPTTPGKQFISSSLPAHTVYRRGSPTTPGKQFMSLLQSTRTHNLSVLLRDYPLGSPDAGGVSVIRVYPVSPTALPAYLHKGLSFLPVTLPAPCVYGRPTCPSRVSPGSVRTTCLSPTNLRPTSQSQASRTALARPNKKERHGLDARGEEGRDGTDGDRGRVLRDRHGRPYTAGPHLRLGLIKVGPVRQDPLGGFTRRLLGLEQGRHRDANVPRRSGTCVCVCERVCVRTSMYIRACTCPHVCTYVRTNVWTCTRTFVCMYLYLYVHVRMCMYVYKCTCAYTRKCVYLCTCPYVYVSILARTCPYVYVRTCAGVYECTHVCVRVCTCVRTSTRVRTSVCVYVRACVYVHKCTCVCARVRMCTCVCTAVLVGPEGPRSGGSKDGVGGRDLFGPGPTTPGRTSV